MNWQGRSQENYKCDFSYEEIFCEQFIKMI